MASKVHEVFSVLEEYNIPYDMKPKIESKYKLVLQEYNRLITTGEDSYENILLKFINLVKTVSIKERSNFSELLNSTRYGNNTEHGIIMILHKMGIRLRDIIEKVPYLLESDISTRCIYKELIDPDSSLEMISSTNSDLDSTPFLAPNNKD